MHRNPPYVVTAASAVLQRPSRAAERSRSPKCG